TAHDIARPRAVPGTQKQSRWSDRIYDVGVTPLPRALVVSFSPIERDSRVLRQLSVVRGYAHVTTVGYGPRPEGSDVHLEIPADAPSLPQTPAGVLRLATRRLQAAELAAPAAKVAIELLEGRRFDVVVAN